MLLSLHPGNVARHIPPSQPEQTAHDLMREIQASLLALAGLLDSLAIGAPELTASAQQYPLYHDALNAGCLETGAACLAEEMRLSSRWAELLATVPADQGAKPLSLDRLDAVTRQRLERMLSEDCQQALDAGEALVALLEAQASTCRWLHLSLSVADGLNPAVGAFFIAAEQLRTLQARADLWVNRVAMAPRQTGTPVEAPA